MDTLTIKRGAPLSLLIDGLDENNAVTPIPANWTAVSKLAHTDADGPLAATFAPVIEDGKIRINHDTSTLDPGTYVMDIKLLDASGQPVDVTENVMIIIEPSPSTPVT